MTSDLCDLWRARQRMGAALDSGLLADDDPAWERFPDLDQAIRKARPTDPAGLAIQIQLLADEFAAMNHPANEKLARRIAVTLETLGQARQHRIPHSHFRFARAATGSSAAHAERPSPHSALAACAGPCSPRRPDRLRDDGEARRTRSSWANRFLTEAAVLIWSINIWLVVARARWMGWRAATRRPAARADGNSAASTTNGLRFPKHDELAVAADPAARLR